MRRSARDRATAERAERDAERGVHAPPEPTTEPGEPSLARIWQDEQDRQVYEKAHGAESDRQGTSPAPTVPRRRQRKLR